MKLGNVRRRIPGKGNERIRGFHGEKGGDEVEPWRSRRVRHGFFGVKVWGFDRVLTDAPLDLMNSCKRRRLLLKKILLY